MKLEDIDITIEKTERRKTVSIFIERNGTVKVLAPVSATDEKIQEVVKTKEYQIFTKLARWKELNHGKVKRYYVNGQSFLYLGKNYRLSIVENQDVPLKISGGHFLLDRGSLNKARKVFKEFYRAKAEQKIKERLKLIAEKFHQKPAAVKEFELQNR